MHSLQKSLLGGLGGLIVFVFLSLLITVGTKAVTEQFASTLAQMTIPALLTFGEAIVGTLFRNGEGRK